MTSNRTVLLAAVLLVGTCRLQRTVEFEVLMDIECVSIEM